jgi:hypothetical protein
MSLELFVGNYNIDAESPPEPEILAKQWLQAHVHASEAGLTVTPPPAPRIDVYVLGFQEVKHFVEGDDVLNFPLTNQDAWLSATIAAMNWAPNGISEADPFVQVHRVVYSSAMLIVAARKSLLEAGSPRFLQNTNSVTHHLHDGVMTGKKGACGVEFDLVHEGQKIKSVAVVTSHFQAYSERLDERIWDARQVVEAMKWPSGATTTQHDVAILVGDLNYRIVLPIEVVKEKIATKDLVPLIHADELYTNTVGVVTIPGDTNTVQVKDPIFVGWKEAPIEFVPTYKFVNGTDRWDDSGKQRTPAWCDRVLIFGPTKTSLYTSAPNLKISDHRPILSLVSL